MRRRSGSFWLPAAIAILGIYWFFTPSEAPRRLPAPKAVESETSLPPPINEPVLFEDEDVPNTALVGDQTLAVIDAILEKVDGELELGVYGEPGSLSYNMIFQFRQSLGAFRRLLEKPHEGPDFRFSLKKEILGRYATGEQKILLGPDTIDSEGVFLVVLFHEYQHHLLHTIMGSPRRGDIVGLFYNELAAHLFEDLLAAYLPASYFDRPYRGSLPVQLRRLIDQERGEKAMELLLGLLLKLRSDDGRLFYSFLEPVAEGVIDPEEVIEAITQDFVPDEEKSALLRERLK